MPLMRHNRTKCSNTAGQWVCNARINCHVILLIETTSKCGTVHNKHRLRKSDTTSQKAIVGWKKFPMPLLQNQYCDIRIQQQLGQ